MTSQFIEAELRAIREGGRWRTLRAAPVNGAAHGVLNFSTNDYLNLSHDSRVVRAAQDAAARLGAGATASRLMAGHLELHEALEAKLAALTRMETALVFPSGYQANLGVLAALCGEGDTIFSDALNHASIVDGCRLSRARTAIYRHADSNHLEDLLRAATGARRRIIVSESIFSMDGDCAPLRDLAALARRHDALLVLDEAHALGVAGNGGGAAAQEGIAPDVLIGTLGKALGAAGGFAAGSARMRELLINRARTFIFTTGLAPACAGAALAAADIILGETTLGAELCARTRRFAESLRGYGLHVPHIAAAIVPLMLGDNARAVKTADTLRERGIWATAIRPPTVPEGTARLRLSVTLAHGESDLRRAADQIVHAVEKA